MTMHCPRDTRDLINRDQISNFALYYRYFLDEVNNKFGLLALNSSGAREEFIQNFKDPEKVFAGKNNILEDLRNRQTDQLRHLASTGEWLTPGHFYCATSQLDWRLVVGLGAEHVQETNMTLDHVYGIPYLPGSTFKGVLRSWVIQEHFGNDEGLAMRDIELSDPANLIKKKEDFFTVFGSQKTAGKVRFLDALPAGNFRFKVEMLDIMNPHFSKYYTSTQFPTDDQQLIPIPFLSLKEVPFRFLIYAKTDDLLRIAKDWFTSAITNLGFGAKSAVGYGYFRELIDKTAELKYEFAEKLSLEKAHDIYLHDPKRSGFVHINIEDLVNYASKFAVIVTEEICEVDSIGGVDDIPKTLIEVDSDVVIPSEFGKWVWEKTQAKVFEKQLDPFPNLIYRSPINRDLRDSDKRKSLQERLLQAAIKFLGIRSDLSADDRYTLWEKLVEIASDLGNSKAFANLPADARNSLAQKLENVADGLDNQEAIPGSIEVGDGWIFTCGGIENGKLVLREYTN